MQILSTAKRIIIIIMKKRTVENVTNVNTIRNAALKKETNVCELLKLWQSGSKALAKGEWTK